LRPRLACVDNPRGTGFWSTSPRTTKNEYIDDTDDNRRAIVLDDNPDPPSAKRTTDSVVVWPRCARMNANTSAVTTSTGSRSTTVKNVFRSNPAASTVFGRHRPAANSKKSSTTR
jgi:hypothetical protein